MHLSRLSAFAVIGATSLLVSCDDGPTVCTTIGEFAIVAEVFDATTGAPNAFEATLVVQDGQYVDSARGFYDGPVQSAAARLAAAEERPGTYTVAVRKAGHIDWQRRNVVVRQGRCHVETQILRVDLTRAGA